MEIAPVKPNYYHDHMDQWDYYYVKQDICPLSRWFENKGRSCPKMLQDMCVRKEKGTYNGICK